jgi:RNA-directed DNA polymerase
VLEPIFEAGFYPTSYGFRPGRSVRGALAHLKTLLLPRGMTRWKKAEELPFPWAIEGDIKGCFDDLLISTRALNLIEVGKTGCESQRR